MTLKVPNPGSDRAIDLGCTCPVLDNGHGNPALESRGFWITEGCPLHSMMTVEAISEYLNCSTEWVEKILEDGELKGRSAIVVSQFKEERDKKRHEVLVQLTQEAQEMGFYD